MVIKLVLFWTLFSTAMSNPQLYSSFESKQNGFLIKSNQRLPAFQSPAGIVITHVTVRISILRAVSSPNSEKGWRFYDKYMRRVLSSTGSRLIPRFHSRFYCLNISCDFLYLFHSDMRENQLEHRAPTFRQCDLLHARIAPIRHRG